MQLGLRSKRIIVLTVVIVAALGVSIFAYTISLPPPKGPKVTITSPPFEFSMSLDKSVYSLHDNVTISFSLRNISNETVTIEKSSMDFEGPGLVATESEGVTIGVGYASYLVSVLFHFGYILYNSSGAVIDQALEGIAQAGYSLVFEPNASLNQTLSKTLAEYRVGQPLSPIQEGSYQISGAIWGLTNAENSTLETPPIKFTIR